MITCIQEEEISITIFQMLQIPPRMHVGLYVYIYVLEINI